MRSAKPVTAGQPVRAPCCQTPNQGTPLLRSQRESPGRAEDLELLIEDSEGEKALLPQPPWPLREQEGNTEALKEDAKALGW